jgi:hypothetical protein
VSIAELPTDLAVRDLSELYNRYKSLASSAAAASILEQPVDVVVDEVDRLLADCQAAMQRPGVPHAQVAACAEAASVLRAALDTTGPDLDEGVRASHRALRRAVWQVVPCEYVPCCADDHHIHRS